MPAETSRVPFLTVLTGATRGPYWPCPTPGTRSPVSAQSCSSDSSTHSPASQPWYVPALMCLGAPAAGEGKNSLVLPPPLGLMVCGLKCPSPLAHCLLQQPGNPLSHLCSYCPTAVGRSCFTQVLSFWDLESNSRAKTMLIKTCFDPQHGPVLRRK